MNSHDSSPKSDGPKPEQNQPSPEQEKPEPTEGIPSNSDIVKTDNLPLLQDGGGGDMAIKSESDQDGEQKLVDKEIGSPLTAGLDNENASHDGDDSVPHIVLQSPPNDSVDVQQKKQRNRDPLLTPQVVKQPSLVDSDSPYIMMTTKSQPGESSISLTNKNMQELRQLSQPADTSQERFQLRMQQAGPASSQSEINDISESDFLSRKVQKQKSEQATLISPQKAGVLPNTKSEEAQQLRKFDSEFGENHRQIFDQLMKQVIQQQIQVLFGQELISPSEKSESDTTLSENQGNLNQVDDEEKKDEIHHRVRSVTHTLAPSHSVDPSDPKKISQILDHKKYKPDRIQSREQSLIRSAAAKAMNMSKAPSDLTEVNRLQSLIQLPEPRETSSDEDYRSAYSQTFNDFAFPVKSSPEEQLQLLRIHCAETASRRSPRDSSRGRIKDFSSERSIPNIFEQDTHYNAAGLPRAVLSSNVAIQTEADSQAAPAPISIATQTSDVSKTRLGQLKPLSIETVISDFVLNPPLPQLVPRDRHERFVNLNDSKQQQFYDSPQTVQEKRIRAPLARYQQEYSATTSNLAMLDCGSSSSHHSENSFEIQGLMGLAADQEIDGHSAEPKSPSQFLLPNQSPNRIERENRNSAQTQIQQNFINALGAVRQDPRISINKLDSSDGKTHEPPFSRIRGTHLDVKTPNAVHTNLTFGNLSPEDVSSESPGTKRARALTFNKEDDLKIHHFKGEIESPSIEEKKGLHLSDNDRNRLSAQKNNINTQTSTNDTNSLRQDQQAQTQNYNQIQPPSNQTNSIGLMQVNNAASTFNKNYKIYSQSPQLMPTIRKPLDTLTKPLPQAIKPATSNNFIGDVLNCSPTSGPQPPRSFHSAAKEGCQSSKNRADAPKEFSSQNTHHFQRTLTDKDEESSFKGAVSEQAHAFINPNQPNLLFQPQSQGASGSAHPILALKHKQSAKTDIDHTSAAPFAQADQFEENLANSKNPTEIHHCECCQIGQALRNQPNASPRSINMLMSASTPRTKLSGEQNSTIKVVEFEDAKPDKAEAPKYDIVAKPQEVWPFIETGREEKTFDQVRLLGEGAFGSVFQVKHKLDEQIYALKKIKMHLQFDPNERPDSRKRTLLVHPAMKEIEAISKLQHKNIVGYKGCWVEAGSPDTTRIARIQAKQLKRKMRRINNGADLSLKDGIDEADDDSEYEFYVKENEELNHQFEKQSDEIYNEDSNSDYDGENDDSGSFHTAKKESDSESYYSESEDDEEASDCASDSSIYQLVDKKSAFASLNIMILMEYAEGETLREMIDQSGSAGLNRKVIYQLFEQLMQALKYIHSQSLIHRDIKPENVFVNPNTGRLQVGDFGLAKRMKTLQDAPEGIVSPTGLQRVRSTAGLREGDCLVRGSFNRQSSLNSNPFIKKQDSIAALRGETGPFTAKAIRDDNSDSDSHVGGTMMYLSPEMRPQPKEVDKHGNAVENRKSMRALQLARTQARDKVDIYAAGLILFEMCGNFTTDMERIRAYDDLQKHREFPKGFTDKFYQESQIISLMTEPVPQKRPTAAFFLNKSPEFQCYSFDLKVKDLI